MNSPHSPPLPELTPLNEHFWTGGRDNKLLITRCGDCGYFIHPPAPICPKCLGRNVGPEAVSGRATVATFTVNYQKWAPTLDVPYTIAIVELPEQVGLRLTTNIVNCSVDEVEIGMPVGVVFKQYGEVFLPQFEPVSHADG